MYRFGVLPSLEFRVLHFESETMYLRNSGHVYSNTKYQIKQKIISPDIQILMRKVIFFK